MILELEHKTHITTAQKYCYHDNKMEMAHFIAALVFSEEWRERKGGREKES